MEKIKCCKFSFSLLFFYLFHFPFFLFSFLLQSKYSSPPNIFSFFSGSTLDISLDYLFHSLPLRFSHLIFFCPFCCFSFSFTLFKMFISYLFHAQLGHFLFRYSNSCFVRFSFFLYFLLFILIFLNSASVENGGQIQGRKVLQHQSSTRLENQHSIPLLLHGIEFRPLQPV